MPLKIKSLLLKNFKCWDECLLSFQSRLVVFHGNGGVGKSSILEGFSMFGCGRGMSMLGYEELANFNSNVKEWGIDCVVESDDECSSESQLKVIGGSGGKRFFINSKESTQNALSKIIIPFWFPQDFLFGFFTSSAYRLKFLDYLVCFFDSSHAKRLIKYKKISLNRLRMLLSDEYNEEWLSAIEDEMALLWEEICAMRNLFLIDAESRRKRLIDNLPQNLLILCSKMLFSIFPTKNLIVESAQNFFRNLLNSVRKMDCKAKKSTVGPHSYDFQILLLGSANCLSRSERILASLILIRSVGFVESRGLFVLLDGFFDGIDVGNRDSILNIVQQLIVDGAGGIWLTLTESQIDWINNDMAIDVVNVKSHKGFVCLSDVH